MEVWEILGGKKKRKYMITIKQKKIQSSSVHINVVLGVGFLLKLGFRKSSSTQFHLIVPQFETTQNIV